MRNEYPYSSRSSRHDGIEAARGSGGAGRLTWRWLVSCALLCAACGDPIAPRQHIEKPRVLAARAETATDAAVATPVRGEDAVVRLLVAGPEALPPVSFALAVCERDSTLVGIAGCGAGISEIAAAAAEPSIALTVPADLPEGATLLALGVVCPAGEPTSTSDVASAFPDGLGCSAGRALRVSFDVGVAPELDNQNPTMDAVDLDGAPWLDTPGAAPGEACAGAGGPELPANGGGHRVTVVLPGASREQTEGGREHLELSWFATGGELERPVSFVEADDSRELSELSQTWTAPKSAPASGRWVELVFVVRDGRGGAAWQRRAVCTVP